MKQNLESDPYFHQIPDIKAYHDAGVIEAANKLLNKSYLPKGYSPFEWEIKDIDSNGNLRIFNKTQEKILTRFYLYLEI